MIKSQDNLNTCNDGKRKSDVLLSAVEKCEKLEEKLKIATGVLEFYAGMGYLNNVVACSNIENHCYCEGDIENGQKAEDALEKIKE